MPGTSVHKGARRWRALAPLALCLALAPLGALAETLYVQVAQTSILKSSSFLSPTIAKLEYGQPVEKLGEGPGEWLEVEYVRSGEKMTATVLLP